MQKNAFGIVKYSPKDILEDNRLVACLKQLLKTWLNYLEIEDSKSNELIKHTISSIKKSAEKNDDLELKLINHYEQEKIIEKMNQKITGRADMIFNYIRHYIPVGDIKILDIGAGTGKLGKKFYDAGYNIILQDVVGDGREKRTPDVTVLQHSDRPLRYDLHKNDERLRYNDGQFDLTLLITVLHHCNDPLSLLKEAYRVTKNRLAIVESVYGIKRSEIPKEIYEENPLLHDLFFSLDEEQQKKYCTFLDWFLNKLAFKNNAYTPFNFNTPRNWEKIFAKMNLKIVAKNMVGIDQLVTPEFHVFYVLEKNNII